MDRSREKEMNAMSKKLDMSKTVYELTNEYPELIDIMAGLGFTEVTKKPMLHSVGKIMTIPKGAKMKNISMMDVVTTLMSNGFELVGDMPVMQMPEEASKKEPANDPADRTEQLKGYLRRLGAGEDLEDVRADFAMEFREVEASEIMKAEQELLKDGTPLTEVQKLCDVHSALFHGATTRGSPMRKRLWKNLLCVRKCRKNLQDGIPSRRRITVIRTPAQRHLRPPRVTRLTY